MIVLAIDPGPEQSAYVIYDTDSRLILDEDKANNDDVRYLAIGRGEGWGDPAGCMAIEMIASYGMPVGAEVFNTCVWIGRFIEAWDEPATTTLVYRRDVKLHLCGSARAKDGNVRQALMDKFGGRAAKGTKRWPGPLYGVSKDVWQALGVAVTWAETMKRDRDG